MSTNVFGASGVSGAGFGAFAPEPAADPNQPEWMKSFQDTLNEIKDKGFRAYAKDLNDKKLAELRAKILEKMGLSESDLQKMSPEGRASIEKMIAEEIRQRLAAETELRGKGKKDSAQGIDGQTTDPVTGQPSGETPADKAAAAALEASAPNGMGAGLTLIRAMETVQAAKAANDPENRQ